MLQMIFTQNIDGLEFDAGITADKLVQAHGHFRTAHCIECKKEASMEEFNTFVAKEEILICECGGLVKPDIVFFGEKLPESFYLNVPNIKNCDLAFVMGTSLTVQPFASLISMVPKDVPLVCINKENPNITRTKNFLFLGGNLDDSVESLMKEIGWNIPIVEKQILPTSKI